MTARGGSTDRSLERTDILEAVAFVVAINVVGGLPGIISSPDSAWFRDLEKPGFYPPEIAFPVVWTLLFTLMGVALWLIWRSSRTGRTLALGLFVAQMAVNVAWTPVFFGLGELFAGLVVIASLWVLVAATIVAFRAVDRRAAALLVPYLLWVTFAAVLNYELWRLNS
ncbi:TspO/MBR family protein [Natronosalvus vescus]|uniref:TspO/MBR family protein n=1 Tax=Natronosalvus vescus TaxID=2953881 RepID=UPI00208FFCCE|nr:TspO/MBR family protein [Natronosalvus vescus]